MFDKLKKAFSTAARGIGQKELSEKVLDDTLLDLEMSMLESDVAQEAVDSLSLSLKKDLLGLRLEKGEEAGKVIQSKLQNSVAQVFANAGKFDLLEKIREKKSARQGPYTIVFLGINGTGKTTTVAKVANLIRKNGLSVVVAAGDTHRSGAIEQLTEHANRLSLKVIAQRYGADPSAVGRDAVEHAKKNHIDVVLVDTAGRMQTSKNLMDEMAKIVRVVKPDSKLFIGDALAGNDTINQAREFFQYSNFDGAILTKIDADAKGGAAISIAHITSRPIVYVGIGQGYDDIIPFEPDKFIESLFGKAGEVRVEDLMPANRTSPPSEFVKDIVEPRHIVAPRAPAEEPKPVSPASGIFALPHNQPAKQVPASKEPKVEASRPVIAAKVPQKEEKPEPPILMPKVEEPAQQEPELVQKVQPKPSGEIKPPAKEQPKEEKKGRFGGLFKKKSGDDEKKDDKKRKADEKHAREEEDRAKLEEEERQAMEKAKEEKKKRKEDKDTKADKVIYLTDEDIEDLLK